MDGILLLDGHLNAERLTAFTRQVDTSSSLHALADGIRANSLWGEMGDALLVGRTRPAPLLAAFGRFTPSQRRLLQGLASRLREVVSQSRYIDYSSAEVAAECLANEFAQRFSPRELAHFQYTAIPRGGLIVLGMLSYLLDLRPDQIVGAGQASSDDDPRTLVIVDDCALSGLRFQQFLTQVDAKRVIFCPLFAAPELCRAIEDDEPRVQACFHAEALRDMAPERYGEAYPQWRDAHRARRGGQGYWDGITEPLAFAWCEPDSRYWNQDRERFEAGWSVIPPGLCLKRRVTVARLARERPDTDRPDTLTLPTEGPGPLGPADRVLWTEIGAAIAVARMPQGLAQTTPCFCLEGTAAAMWQSVLAHGSIEAAAAALLDCYDVDSARLRDDLTEFVSELMDNGILKRRSAVQCRQGVTV